MHDMKKLGIVASILLATVALAQEAPAESPPEPPPPQSFCGFTFGEVYTNAAHVSLARPFRYCNKANILTTSERKIFRIIIEGRVNDMSEADMQKEFSLMRETIEKRFDILLVKNRWGGTWYEYKDGKFSIHVDYFPNGRSVSFSVNATRIDILDSDVKSARKGAPPLPPGDGIDNL